ncbi:MAG TPA: HAD family hydrolase [Gaiellaceae bacterium]|nr:HAD family hydrolase [Gaiellaceae bacterium]
MIALFWDIDGTLLTTARAGVFALEDALEEVTGVRVELQGKVLASGLTEHQVADAVFAIAAVEPEDELTDRFLRAYERHLPASLPRRDGRVLPGVREILEDLRDHADVRSYLLTGNTPAGARAKLTHYGLLEFFTDGAYCIGPGPRTVIAQQAATLAGDADELYVIGDTPFDIEAGKAIGALTIAVATGSHTSAELAEHEPWVVLESLPLPDEFRRLVGAR